jgi:hypothetical protein
MVHKDVSTIENKTSKRSTSTTRDAAATAATTATAAVNVTLFDVANKIYAKLVNEAGKVQPQYAQVISNLQQEYIEAARNAIQTITSVEKQFANSNSSNFVISDSAVPYIQGFVRQSNDFINNVISIAEINNQLTINALNAFRENVRNSSRAVVSTAEFNSNLAKAWATSYSAVQQQ